MSDDNVSFVIDKHENILDNDTHKIIPDNNICNNIPVKPTKMFPMKTYTQVKWFLFI